MSKLKQKIICALTTVTMLCTYITYPVSAQNTMPKAGETISGFLVTDVQSAEEYDGKVFLLKHKKTDATVIYVANDDENKTFDISFRTPPQNNKGTSHIFEHSTLSGSQKYPSSTLFMKLSNQTYNTFMNAATDNTCTSYPVSSLSEDQLYALTDYYLDSVFNPMLYTDKSVFDREAWHYEMNDAASPLTVSGTVYSEIQGSTDIVGEAYQNTIKAMFPDSVASYKAGGDVYEIPNLTYEEVVDYHKTYYHPSNSLTFLYGNLDCTKFLTLLNEYFMKYDKKQFDIDFKSYTPTDNKIEATYDYPVAANAQSEGKSVITYAYECKDATAEEMEALSIAVDLLMSLDSFSDTLFTTLPGASVSVGICTYTSQPMLVFAFENVDESDTAAIKNLLETSIEYVTYSLSGSMKQTLIARYDNSEAAQKHSSTANVGVGLALDGSTDWSATGDPMYIFERNDVLNNISGVINSDAAYKATVKYLANAGTRQALVITKPAVGMKEKLASEFAQKLADKKASMSEEEINTIVENTKKYKKDASNQNTELDKELIGKLNVLAVHDLPENIKYYAIKETTTDDIRFVNTVSESADFGRGRVMIDISNIPVDDLKWLGLYVSMLGNFSTENLKVNNLYYLANDSMIYNINFETIESDNANGFTPYLVFAYQGYGENLENVFKYISEVVFRTVFDDKDRLQQLIGYYADSYDKAGESIAESMLMADVFASTSDEDAYLDYIAGVKFVENIPKIAKLANLDIKEVISKLNNIQKLLRHRNGMIVVYSGSEENIKKNNNCAVNVFKDFGTQQWTPENYTGLRTEYKNKAVVMDTDVNINGIYAPMDKLGIEYDAKADVVFAYVTDKYLLPELRNKHNAYGVILGGDSDGIGIISTSDPELVNTFYTYSKLGDMLENSDITQEDIDRYIMSVYSGYAIPSADLYDAYSAAMDYVNGITSQQRVEDLRSIKSTTADDVKNYSTVFKKLWDEGVIFTAGNTDDIIDHKILYDEILNPAKYNIDTSTAIAIPTGDGVKVMINESVLESDVPAQIVDGRTLVPLRAIFEALDMKVEWDSATSTVTAVGDGISIEMTIGKDEFYKDGDAIALDVPAQIIGERTMVPVRAISESLGCLVNWDGENQLVTVIK